MSCKLPVLLILVLFFGCNDSSPDYDNTIPQPKVYNIPAPEPLIYKIENVFPHDTSAFTQGLEYYKGKLYESTGELEKSRLRITEIVSGKGIKDHLLTDKTIFGEGITILNHKIYQLTWQNHKIFVYEVNDITKPIKTFNWSREGWGITNDGKNLIISDGTSKLYFVEPPEAKNEMKINKIITVITNEGEVDSLNELEYINGFVYANIWFTNEIVKIDPSNGHVVGVMNLKGLLHQYDPGAKLDEGAVLNGIAYDSTSKKMYITGKNWPKLFELTLK